MVQKIAYYTSFDTVQFLAGKELLKSMPTFFNRVYFCSKYGQALLEGEGDRTFSDIAMICKEEEIVMLRNIIKNNFLYLSDWDSAKFIDEDDYGFSFIAGNIKYILMPFREYESGYIVKYFDVNTGMCWNIDLNEKNKKFFLDTSVTNTGEILRLCDFNLEEANENNTKKQLAPKKDQPQMAVYNSNTGFLTINMFAELLLVLISILVVIIAYSFIKFHLS